MAKKTKSYSHVDVTRALENLAQTGTSASEFIYHLLRIFAGYGDGQIKRIKEGTGNSAKDGKTVLVKKLVAYRTAAISDDHDDCSMLYDVVREMVSAERIAKHSPRMYIASDGEKLVVYDPKSQQHEDSTIEKLWRGFEFLNPLAGIEKVPPTPEAEADVKSAELMAKLFDDIRRYNPFQSDEDIHLLNVFMSRLLFCFFAEDTGLFPGENLFTNTIKTYTTTGSDVMEFLRNAFRVMSTDSREVRDSLPLYYDKFPYVNGGLFSKDMPIPTLSRRARQLMINCGEYDWRNINPDIFGSMIQAVIKPDQRAGLGIHYTSVPNINKVINPLFMDALNEEFDEALCEAKEKVAKKVSPERAIMRLQALLQRMSEMKFFDPACGSGNFLIISYKRLRELEIRIWKAMNEIGMCTLPFPRIQLRQFYGIELFEYACDTATLSLWLAEHQMNVLFQKELSVNVDTLPLKSSGNIFHNNACRVDWSTICPHTPNEEVYIMGNPPYQGSKMQDKEQKEDMKIAMRGTDATKTLDYIGAWFWLASKYIRKTKAKYAFVTTNSLTQGEQVAMLWKPIFELGLEISFAYTSFKWSNNAKHNAAVTVVIIGVENHNKKQKVLFNETNRSVKIVNSINPYLSEGESIIIQKSNCPPTGYPETVFGSMPRDGGFLIISREIADEIRINYPEVYHLVKRYIGSQEFIQDYERFCLWIEDTNENIRLANENPIISERLIRVKEERIKSDADSTRAYASRPHMFVQRAYQPTDAIIVPAVSSERRQYIPIGYVDKNTIISNSAFAIYNAEKWLFALLNTRMHNLWVRAVGGSLETRIRYSATLCYNTFPFPYLNEEQKDKLSYLADRILDIREEYMDYTPAMLYNPETMPGDLLEAHRRLDLAVERIYRPEPFTSDEERLEHLFKLYAKMTKK